MSEQSDQAVRAVNATQPPPADYRCQVCGRQDETLRVVGYPFVISLIVITYRRAFAGLWCRRHRLRYRGLAGLISAIIGWFGIPFGFFFTPVALWKVARGGDMPAEPNQAMLKDLAEQKLRSGDRRGAIRCLEAALSLGDDAEAQQALGSRAAYESSLFVTIPLRSMARFVGLLGASLALGIAVGVINYLFASLFSQWAGEEILIYVAILSWVPLVALAVFASLALIGLIEWALAVSRVVSMPLGLGLSIFAAALIVYGIPLGKAVSDMVLFASSGASFPPLQWLFIVGQTLTLGGIRTLQAYVQSGEPSDVIYLAILAVSAMYILFGSVGIAHRTVRWQQRIEAAIQRVTNWRPTAALTGWAAIGGVLVFGAMFTFLFSLPPGILTSSPEAFEHNQTGMDLLDGGDFVGAIDEFEQAVRLDPESAELRTNLGVAYLYAGRLSDAESAFAEATRLEPDSFFAHFGMGAVQLAFGDLAVSQQELATCLDLAPWFPLAHLLLGNLRAQLGDLDGSVLHLEQAIQMDPSIADAHSALALAYLERGEFEMALSQAHELLALDSDSAEAYAIQSMAYRRLGRFDRAEESLRTAEALALQAEDPRMVAAAFADINDFSQAEVYLVQSGSSMSWIGNHLLSLAGIYTRQGKLDQGLDAIEQSAALGGDPVMILESRSAIYIEMMDLASAQDQLSEANQIMPERGSVHAGLALVHLYKGEAQAAEREARRSLELAPYAAGTHAILALSLHAQGEVDMALAEAQEAVRLDPMRDLGHYALGLCHRSLGDDQQARADFERFLELYWDRAFARDYRTEVEEYLHEP